MRKKITEFSTYHPWIVIAITVAITGFFAVQFPNIKIDTDPENMLPADEPARLFDHAVKDDFGLSDFIAVGVVEEDGAFNPEILNRIYRITAEIEEIDGVIVEDILAPSTVDDIEQGPGGSIVIGTLMKDEITTQEEADHIFDRIMANPMLRGKLASENGKAIALFIPIEAKDMSHRIAGQLKEITGRLGGGEAYHIAGLPVAEDSFGAEMFVQMAVGAPAAMVVIFLLMLMFFRQVRILIAPMVVAMMSIIWTMGLLIATGNTVHIMSSMIPVFLMPIAILDSIHIISEFHDRYKPGESKAVAIRKTIGELFTPMLFTSLTTMAGFLSLALAPIPPVQVFGIFVAFGVAMAWVLSLTLNPAIGVLISDKALRNFGKSDDSHGPMTKLLHALRGFAQKRNKLILAIAGIVVIVAAFGLNMIVVNDNPVRWFKQSHPIRQADAVMNANLAGTYMNYLVLEGENDDTFKNPEVLAYMERLQELLEKEEIVGATTGITDIVKKVRYEVMGADIAEKRLPDSQAEVAQLLFLFEMSGGDPDDLFKFVTTGYDKANLWVQLKAGDNLAVSAIVEKTDSFIAENPPPVDLSIHWAGLPYINIVWQHKMVSGMRSSLVSSFVVVLIMMTFLFRSFKWGLVSILPLSLTIMAIYSFIGYIGKPYDMPVAVLSSLTLGLSIDFAIHFIQRLRTLHARLGSFEKAYEEIFEGTGRAIVRNVLVIAIGFVPMLFSTLVPYITVGAFFLAIMIVSGLATMLLLPALAVTFRKSLFPEARKS